MDYERAYREGKMPLRIYAQVNEKSALDNYLLFKEEHKKNLQIQLNKDHIQAEISKAIYDYLMESIKGK